MSKISGSAGPSSNWEQLKKTIPKPVNDKGKGRELADPHSSRSQKRAARGRYLGIGSFMQRQVDQINGTNHAGPSKITVDVPAPVKVHEGVSLLPAPSDSALLIELREMVTGRNPLNDKKKEPGNYIAVDCEMVGLGHLGSESALARVSLVNFHGHVLLDTFVQPRETVTDWRTWVSGIRESDLIGAPSFEEVQAKVAKLVEGRVLVGHAIENDLKAMLLDHPGPLVRDTQKFKVLREKARSKHPSLRKLCEMELGLGIQKGAHSSVTDARATMALYRLHKVEWEKSVRHATEAWRAKQGQVKQKEKRKRESSINDDTLKNGDEEDGGDDNAESHPLAGHGPRKERRRDSREGGKKGISSGLGKIVRINGQRVEGRGEKRARGAGNIGEVSSSGGKWWESPAG